MRCAEAAPTERTVLESRETAIVAAQAAFDKKAEDIVVMDLTGISDVTDYFMICTVSNNRQADAVIDEIEDLVYEKCSEKPFSIEGRAQGQWTLLDYGHVIVHVFTPETRDHYRLETLWGDAPRVELDLA